MAKTVTHDPAKLAVVKTVHSIIYVLMIERRALRRLLRAHWTARHGPVIATMLVAV